MLYQISVKRQIQVLVEIEADNEQDALFKYEVGNFESKEEIVDSSDIELPTVCNIQPGIMKIK